MTKIIESVNLSINFLIKKDIKVALCNLYIINKHFVYLKNLLNKSEQAIFYKYKTKKRRLQFLAGRILSKYLLIRTSNSFFVEKSFKNIKILRSNNLIPKIIISNKVYKNIDISISHKNNYVFVVLSNDDIGCDIEKINPKIINIMNRYSKNTEHQIINNADLKSFSKALYYTCLWASKEAILKCIKANNLFEVLSSTYLKKINNLCFTFYSTTTKSIFYSQNIIFKNYILTIAKKQVF